LFSFGEAPILTEAKVRAAAGTSSGAVIELLGIRHEEMGEIVLNEHSFSQW
jgi:hypothetical protein